MGLLGLGIIGGGGGGGVGGVGELGGKDRGWDGRMVIMSGVGEGN